MPVAGTDAAIAPTRETATVIVGETAEMRIATGGEMTAGETGMTTEGIADATGTRTRSETVDRIEMKMTTARTGGEIAMIRMKRGIEMMTNEKTRGETVMIRMRRNERGAVAATARINTRRKKKGAAAQASKRMMTRRRATAQTEMLTKSKEVAVDHHDDGHEVRGEHYIQFATVIPAALGF